LAVEIFIVFGGRCLLAGKVMSVRHMALSVPLKQCYAGDMNGDDMNDLKLEVGGLRQDVRHLSVLVEQVVSQNQGVLEAVGDIQQKVADLPTRTEFDELKQDVRIIKAAVGDVSRDLAEHKSLPAHVAHGRA
jgi:hypothetical protein